MNYREAIDFLFSQLPAYHRVGKAAYKNNLDNTIALDTYFGNPHKRFKTIHVAGTNGKGSVAHMVASVLQEAGYKTGLYTSPHLKDFRERIKIDGEMISENDVVSFVSSHKTILDSLRPSFFEMTVAMAFEHFAKNNVDVAVIEVGLGGRLDSTNIIFPVLSVITNIGHDHMDMLGDTLEKIAIEKAGIIKPEVPVVISESNSETTPIISSVAESLKAPFTIADKMFSCTLGNVDIKVGNREYTVVDIAEGKIYSGTTVLQGNYQTGNIKAVFAIFYQLKEVFEITSENISNGIEHVVKNTGLMGRWQVLNDLPLTICDTGHNREGLKHVLDQINLIPKSGLHIIIGFVNDKDLSSVLPLFPKDATYYFTKANIQRAINEHVLQSEAGKYNLKGESYPDVHTALHSAKENALKSDVIFIGGSTFIVGELL